MQQTLELRLGMSGTFQQQQVELTEEEKQRLLSEIDTDISEIEASFDNPNSLVARMWRTEKREIINFWGQRLEQKYLLTGQPERVCQIATEITKRIQKLRGVEDGYTYAYDISPAKWKSHDENPEDDSDIRVNNSSLNTENHKEENKPIRDMMLALIEAIEQDYLPKLDNKPFASLLTKDELNEYLLIGYSFIKMFKEVLDDREKIPSYAQMMLLDACIKWTASEAGDHTFNKIKKDMELTGKQTRKHIQRWIRGAPINYQEGRIDYEKIESVKGKLLVVLEPKNRDEALKCGFSGRKCPECGFNRVELRLKRQAWTDHCYVCNKDLPPQTPLYSDPNARTIVLDESNSTHSHKQY